MEDKEPKVLEFEVFNSGNLADAFAEIEREDRRVERVVIHPNTLLGLLVRIPDERCSWNVDGDGIVTIWGATVDLTGTCSEYTVRIISEDYPEESECPGQTEVLMKIEEPISAAITGIDLKKALIHKTLLAAKVSQLEADSELREIYAQARVCKELIPEPADFISHYGDVDAIQQAFSDSQAVWGKRATGYPVGDQEKPLWDDLDRVEMSWKKFCEDPKSMDFLADQVGFKPVILVTTVGDYAHHIRTSDRRHFEIFSGSSAMRKGLMGFYLGVYVLTTGFLFDGVICLLGEGHGLGTNEVDRSKIALVELTE